ncbi:MAG: hypothetical protein KAS04_00170 [Candidatus Aenigmarchaeota archaeon]|nr:hypothetical protein [Candidatus Aenigmarchaeota archaeon]
MPKKIRNRIIKKLYQNMSIPEADQTLLLIDEFGEMKKREGYKTEDLRKITKLHDLIIRN